MCLYMPSQIQPVNPTVKNLDPTAKPPPHSWTSSIKWMHAPLALIWEAQLSLDHE
jgi:hypothetical protein